MGKSGSKSPVLVFAAVAAASAGLLAAVVILRGGLGGDRGPSPTDSSTGELAQPQAQGDPGATRSAASTEAILASVDELVRQGETDRAEAVLRAAIGEQPEDQELRLALAGACVLREQFALAYEQYEAALAIGPRTPGIEFTAGTVASKLNRLDRAEEHFSAAQASNSSDPRYPLYLAQVQMKAGNNAGARKNLILATRLDESLAIAWGALAELSLRESEPNVALQMVERARALEPAVAAWRVIEARACNRVRQPERALASLGGINDEERRQLPVLRLIGESYGLLGKPAEAMRTFEAAAAASPDSGELMLDTAVWCERAGEDERARMYAERAATLGLEAGAEMAARLSAAPEEPG